MDWSEEFVAPVITDRCEGTIVLVSCLMVPLQLSAGVFAPPSSQEVY